MPVIDLPRTTSFRLALLFLVLFGAASLALFGFIYGETKGYLLDRIDNWLVREETRLMHLDTQELVRSLDLRVAYDLESEHPFAVFDAEGKRFGGSPIDLPPPATLRPGEPFDFVVKKGTQGRPFRGLVQRLQSGDLLLVAQDLSEVQEFDEVLINAMILGAIVTAGLGLIGAAMAGAGAVRRIDAVTLAIQRIVTGDLSGRLPSHGTSDDLDRLIQVVNGMLDEIERLMHEVKDVCDNIAHDLRTPLTRLLAGLERASRRATSVEQYGAAVEEAILEIKGVLKTFTAMLRLSELEAGDRRAGFTTVDLLQVATHAAEFYEPLAEARGITLSLAPKGDGPAEINGDPNLLFEAIGNLVDNAIKFTPTGGQIVLHVFDSDGSSGVAVSDTGPGIPPHERDAVLRRFHRAEKSRHTPGIGLGLSLVAAIARLHGMHLAIGDGTPGCCITLSGAISQGRFPDAAEPGQPPQTVTAPAGPERLLDPGRIV
jgi:signal transduction histidine kinase